MARCAKLNLWLASGSWQLAAPRLQDDLHVASRNIDWSTKELVTQGNRPSHRTQQAMRKAMVVKIVQSFHSMDRGSVSYIKAAMPLLLAMLLAIPKARLREDGLTDASVPRSRQIKSDTSQMPQMDTRLQHRVGWVILHIVMRTPLALSAGSDS